MKLPISSSVWPLSMLLLILAPRTHAQFTQLSATDDAKQLFFSSQLLLRGAPPSDSPAPETRIYRAAPDGVTLFAERGALAPQDSFSSNDGASLAQASGEGSVIGFTLHNICQKASDRTSPVAAEAQIRGKQNLDLGPGEPQLSRNGRWALLTVGAGDPTSPAQSTLVNLETGERTPVPPPPRYIYFSPTYHTIASDGTLLVEMPGQGSSTPVPGLWKQGRFTPVDLSPQAISDDAGTLIYAGSEFGPTGFTRSRIVATNVASRKQVLLFQSQDKTHTPLFMGMSNNGRFVLYRVGVQNALSGPAYIADTQTGQTAEIKLAPGELAADGTITGAGDFVFFATTAGRIIRFNTAKQTLDTVVPAVPHCDDPNPLAPGSLARLHCNIQGSAAELQQVFRLNDVPVPVLWTTPAEIAAQIPWESRSFFGDTLTIDLPNGSPFQAAQAIQVLDMVPRFELADPNDGALLGLKLIKGDWSGLLTSQPNPGDIIYTYRTGLGAVKAPWKRACRPRSRRPSP